MPVHSTYHSSFGGFDFLGYRKGASGALEIIYDDGVKRRLVWRVLSQASEGHVGDALRSAVNHARVLPAMYAELRKRAIAIEAVV